MNLRPVACWCRGFRESRVGFLVGEAVAAVVDVVVKEEEEEEEDDDDEEEDDDLGLRPAG